MKHEPDRKVLLRLAAHAVLSPLTSIANQAQLILSGIDGRINKEVRHDVEGIARDASELKTRLDAVVELLRLASEMPIFELLGVSRVIQEAAASTKWPEGIDHPIHIQVGANVREMWADRGMLYVLLRTAMHIVGRAADTGPIGLRASYSRGQLRFWMAPGDTEQPLIRAAFVDMPGRQVRGVSSIDIMICQRLAQLHGGALG
ncbi:MAG: HAMP domain-containing histidine kinase, partial [Anaerolineae bacterium]|nr:HAMP domain-containing histidine kinase [Anaerolineae bacterium]